MYQWRKFEFFEEKYGGKRIIEEGVSCCSSGRGKIAVGCQDGTVSLLDRGFKFSSAFQAHTSNVLFLQQLKQRNFLLTVGEDEQISPQILSVCLKVFDLDKLLPEGPSTSIPDCIQILRIFTNQFPEAKVVEAALNSRIQHFEHRLMDLDPHVQDLLKVQDPHVSRKAS